MHTPLDWKRISQSEGYKFFKQQYISTIKRESRSKKGAYREFQRIIGVAKNRAFHHDALTGTEALIDVLNLFSAQCDYWYYNFRPERVYKNRITPCGIRGELTHYRNYCGYTLKQQRKRSLRCIMQYQKQTMSPKGKTRWKNDKSKQYKLKQNL